MPDIRLLSMSNVNVRQHELFIAEYYDDSVKVTEVSVTSSTHPSVDSRLLCRLITVVCKMLCCNAQTSFRKPLLNHMRK